jgi:hypothetical protein
LVEELKSEKVEGAMREKEETTKPKVTPSMDALYPDNNGMAPAVA